MINTKQIYLEYWKQLKFYIDERGMDWRFYSFEGVGETVVKIGSPKLKVSLSLNGPHGKSVQPVLAAGYWIPDSKEEFTALKTRRAVIEFEMGQSLVWDAKPGRKSSWIWVTVGMSLSDEQNWPASFEWFSDKAQKIRDICYKHLYLD